MQEDKDTRLKLLKSARKEFVQKGYSKASLRSICADAGVTTGALYFFFKDKDDLFEEVMKEPLAKLYGAIMGHFSMETEAESIPDNDENDVDAAAQILKVLYKDRDLFLMLLTRAQGSKLENVPDQFVSFVENHYRNFAAQFEKISGKKFRGKGLLHWVAHNQVDMFVFILEHCDSERAALKLVPGLVSYLTGGWYALFD